eukprot:comp21329_c0_seq1/m.29223 comp21329_c0_seq1/g.29223  ORF comp21329_c0_seq1/g.29223 comp21329_c0_seq1/m.29223 type:complete len:196 (-) comp21329_c0_seq1:361-948(-)
MHSTVFVVALAAAGHAAVTLKRQDAVKSVQDRIHYPADASNNASFSGATNGLFDQYGKWCGGKHGGFQDCCHGRRCEGCKIKHGVQADTLLTEECLKQCPPIDELDAACAWHDACTFSYDTAHLPHKCLPQGNFCPCDCKFLQKAADAQCDSLVCPFYKAGIDLVIGIGVNCAAYTNETGWFCRDGSGIELDDMC